MATNPDDVTFTGDLTFNGAAALAAVTMTSLGLAGGTIAAAVAGGDDLVVGDVADTAPGATFLCSATGTASILFGDDGDNDIGGVTYAHTSNTLTLRANAASQLTCSGTTVSLTPGGTANVACTATTLGFFGATPTTQPADMLDLTDSTAGTPGTTLAAMPNPADTPLSPDALRDDIVANLLPPLRDNIASLGAQVDKIRVALRALGLMA